MNETSDSRNRVAALATRLRMLQADLADEPEEVRRRYLSEEIQNAAARLLPAEREAFLRELERRFPTQLERSEGNGQLAASPQPAEASSLGISEILGRLDELAQSMGDDEREYVLGRLREMGFVAASSESASAKSASRLCKILDIKDPDALDCDRVAEAAGVFGEVLCKLDRLTWTNWQQLVPQSRIRPTGSLQQVTRAYLTGESSASSERFQSNVRFLGDALGILSGRIGVIIRQLAQRVCKEFKVSNIEQWAESEGSGMPGWLKSKEQKCWAYYCRRHGDLRQDTLEHEWRTAVTQELEQSLSKSFKMHSEQQ